MYAKHFCKHSNFNTVRERAPYQMNLTITLLDRGYLAWKIQYQGEGIRDYQMIPTKNPGHYILDENNGIKIQRFVKGNELRDSFLINQKYFHSVTKLIGDSIEMMTTSFWQGGALETSLADGSNSVQSFILRDTVSCKLRKK